MRDPVALGSLTSCRNELRIVPLPGKLDQIGYRRSKPALVPFVSAAVLNNLTWRLARDQSETRLRQRLQHAR